MCNMWRILEKTLLLLLLRFCECKGQILYVTVLLGVGIGCIFDKFTLKWLLLT